RQRIFFFSLKKRRLPPPPPPPDFFPLKLSKNPYYLNQDISFVRKLDSRKRDVFFLCKKYPEVKND
ncbi:MAG: hypothetical protein FWG98_03400, partial [Candidatus Cloacimonetes bacterium]|nr:hypothetical protein [Candidatus Cloacimonadota bacterium]